MKGLISLQKLPKLTLVEIENYLKKRFEESGGLLNLSDLPHPSTFKDMDKACKRIVAAINNREKIIIVGDYDVDGVISTTILSDFFESIKADVKWFIPNRFEHGYGLSTKILSYIQEFDLIITVDNGITATDVASWCLENNKTLIITDHHTPPKNLPNAFAIINPKQDDCTFIYPDICGAMVAWYLIAGLKEHLKLKINLKSYLALVAIATIADVMPLLHINRAIVIAGLKELNNSQKPFVAALKNHLRSSKFKSDDISFWIAPILNSAGRMSDASQAVYFLKSIDMSDAYEKLAYLADTNEKRKIIEEKISNQAKNQILNPDGSILIIRGDDWHEGVLGIVATRMVRFFKKPAIVLSKSKEGLLKGSGRSIKGFDLFASIDPHRDIIEKFGGHPMAIGISLKEDKLQEFIDKLPNYYEICTDDSDKALGEIELELINDKLFALLDNFEPYGEANPHLVFASSNINIKSAISMGKNSEHRRYQIYQNGKTIEAIHFNPINPLEINEYDKVSYIIRKSIFKNVEILQLLIK
ncbi:MAG: single-stranded-DNA-specific exonuclease RecJ [Sulfurovaceae bacterium]|nr:single-stranded-DNA-specific exonuclease RecJ [Sulfurovaceae bacterium]